MEASEKQRLELTQKIDKLFHTFPSGYVQTLAIFFSKSGETTFLNLVLDNGHYVYSIRDGVVLVPNILEEVVNEYAKYDGGYEFVYAIEGNGESKCYFHEFSGTHIFDFDEVTAPLDGFLNLCLGSAANDLGRDLKSFIGAFENGTLNEIRNGALQMQSGVVKQLIDDSLNADNDEISRFSARGKIKGFLAH